MGTLYSIACKDCKIVRNLSKFYGAMKECESLWKPIVQKELSEEWAEMHPEKKEAEKSDHNIPEYTQGVCADGAAILADGKLLPIDELVDLLNVNEKLLAERQRVLDSIPECPIHGGNCVPHAIEWIDKMKSAFHVKQEVCKVCT